jgi:hypothetical protein
MAQENMAATAPTNKPFLKTKGGKIATGVLTGGLGLAATGIFGKSKLTRQMEEAMKNIQGLGLSPEMMDAYQKSQALAGQGMDAASRQMAIQQQARGQNALASQARSKRSFLASAPGLLQSSSDFALRLAADDAMIRRENQLAGIQTGMQFGQAQSDLQKYKAEAVYNELSAKKARRAQTLSGLMSFGGQVLGAALGKPK